MEVASFHPRTGKACAVVLRDSSLWPSSSRRRARALPCIPLCGARTFLCARAQRLPGRLRLRFYRAGAEIARVVVELGALGVRSQPGKAEDRQRRQVARRVAGRSAPSQASAAASGSAAAGTTIALQVIPGRGSSACSSTAWPTTTTRIAACSLSRSPRTASSNDTPAEATLGRVVAPHDRAAFVEDGQQVAQRAARARPRAGSPRRAWR